MRPFGYWPFTLKDLPILPCSGFSDKPSETIDHVVQCHSVVYLIICDLTRHEIVEHAPQAIVLVLRQCIPQARLR